MAQRNYRWLATGILATGGAGVLGMAAMLHPAPALADETNYALILGPDGFEDVSATPLYQTAVDNLYLQNPGVIDGATGLPYSHYDFTLVPVNTPEQALPTSLAELNSSTGSAVADLNSAIQTAITDADGGQVVVFGYSEGATTAFLEQSELEAATQLGGGKLEFNPDQLTFVLVGDPSNPDGGLYERLIPSIGAELPFHTDIYTQEYDGFADFPQYPTDFLADLNALMGDVYDHLTYANLTQADIAGATQLDVSAADTTTNYYMIDTQDLPLLEPLRLMGEPGNYLADLLQPDLTLLVNLGYGNLSFTEGYSTGPADVATTFGLMPDVNMAELGPMLQEGWQMGVANASADLGESFTFGTSPALQELEDAAYTFGITTTPDPSLQELLNAVGTFGADELGFGPSYAGVENAFGGLTDGFQSFEAAFTNFEAAFTNFEDMLSTPWTLGGAAAADELTSGALDATPLATSLSDFTADFLSQLPGLF